MPNDTVRYLDDERFHQTFTPPPDANRPSDPELKVTYADFGHRNDERVMLFCGPLLGSRFVLATKDKLAKRYGVRIISPDRPGFGGTTDVEPADRIRVWLHIVEALLQHLGIKQVSILGYSAGSVYAMEVLFNLRHLLHPTRPYVALCAPWVHPSRSGVLALKLVRLMPDALVSNYDRVVQVLYGGFGLAFQFSDLVGSTPSLGGGSFFAPGVDPADVAQEESLLPELIARFKSEQLRGLGKDVLLLLKHNEFSTYWGSKFDYDALVPLLAQAEKSLRVGDSAAVSPLQVDVFFAESDNIIGATTAPAWFSDCWRPEQGGDFIKYSSVTIPKTTHDSLLELRYGVIERIFQAMSKQNDS
ncbi:putative interferon-induced GTP-binding protein Mx2 [Rosellinia necatrix]|uniref:Putative interferon-induced GTP-binding protein Mx2 n=1 Tax=Rosellinia necatrix TaxID=77044 RepID=A0A1S7ULL3_ROSNE|nr:putative interferon-induced GTP-binding protein Mx2 [Rosellinia necatrix]